LIPLACCSTGVNVADVVNAHAMSLNGLDAAAVIEAYHAALAEAGGW